MASCSTTQWATASPYVKLTVTKASETDTAVTLKYVLQYIATSPAITSVAKAYTVKLDGSTVADSTFNINGKTGTITICSGTKTINKSTKDQTINFSVSFAFNLTWGSTYKGTATASGSISIDKKTSYTISYNANGGTGAPSSQTKWHGTAITLSSVKPTRTGYTFQGWGLSSTGSVKYAAGATYAENASDTLYAIWKAKTYTVSYNANGGSGAPTSQTKTHGQTLKLSTVKPTRVNYTFMGWATSANATTATYAAGANYTTNAGATLYAVWELSYTKPRITNVSAERCTSDGTTVKQAEAALAEARAALANATDITAAQQAVTDAETLIANAYKNAKIAFTWASDLDINTGTVKAVITCPTNTSFKIEKAFTYAANTKSGTVSQILGNNGLSSDYIYNVEIIVKDSSGESKKVATLTSLVVPIEVKNGGKGVAIGKPAVQDNVFEVGFHSKLREHVYMGKKESYLDGNAGFYFSKDGYMHIQRYAATGSPYIGFYLDKNITPSGIMMLRNDNKYLTFTNAAGYAFDSELYVKGSLRLGYTNDYNKYYYIGTWWADNDFHYLVSRATDGLTSYLGWAGSSDYSTVTTIRGQTCKYSNAAGTTTLSDERLKKDFEALDKWSAFFNALEPCAFKMKNGASGRYHLGFKAQQVEKALKASGLTTQDFAGFIKSPYKVDEDDPERAAAYEAAGIKEGDDEYGLIYSEFTALNTYKIQQLQKEVDTLKNEVAELKAMLKEALKG